MCCWFENALNLDCREHAFVKYLLLETYEILGNGNRLREWLCSYSNVWFGVVGRLLCPTQHKSDLRSQRLKPQFEMASILLVAMSSTGASN